MTRQERADKLRREIRAGHEALAQLDREAEGEL